MGEPYNEFDELIRYDDLLEMDVYAIEEAMEKATPPHPLLGELLEELGEDGEYPFDEDVPLSWD